KTEILEKNKPHPAAKLLCTLHKDDYLEFTDSGKMHLCRIAGFSATQNKVTISPIYAVSNAADWINSTNEYMLEGYWKPISGAIAREINILFDKLQAQYVTVSPIGKIFRKKK
ncbi:MAG: type II CRISPR RNA-guided endonuclease Cas9, partial [Treponema sp.]|nr:type II CRISPR RNA-guided endonuclease Cas9 [Treponema sp.]